MDIVQITDRILVSIGIGMSAAFQLFRFSIMTLMPAIENIKTDVICEGLSLKRGLIITVSILVSISPILLTIKNAGVLLDTLQFALPSIAFGLTVTLYYSLSRAFGHGFGYTVGIMFLPFIFVLLLGVGRSRYTRPDKYRDKF